MLFKISVIICTHNPRIDYLSQVLNALKIQTFNIINWELLIIDNASNNSFFNQIDLTWHPNYKLIREDKIGLTYARITGIENSNSEILIFVDDDNILNKDYLENVTNIFDNYNNLAAIGGKSLPEYEKAPPNWFNNLNVSLGCRDLGNEEYIYFSKDNKASEYPFFAPIGSGLVLQKKAAKIWVKKLNENDSRKLLGRSGKKLISGEDNDIVLTSLNSGYGIGYFPNLNLKHLIPASRLERKYLAKLNYESHLSWIKVLDIHGIRPWPKISKWTVIPRKINAFIRDSAWKNSELYINWCGKCGKYEGQADLK